MADFEDNNPFADSDRPMSDTESHNDVDAQIATESQATRRHFASRIEHILEEFPDITAQIIDAGKNREGGGSGYIAYTIRIDNVSTRRRYSEFESLRACLEKMFPTEVIPPIPEKHSMTDYAASPTKAKEDVNIIQHRQRMLTVFLNRCLRNPRIRGCSVFQRFLDPNVSWSEVLNDSPVIDLPKSVLKAPPTQPWNPTPAHQYLPIPSGSSKKVVADPSFVAMEENSKEYEAVISNGLEKVNRRLLKHLRSLSTDLSALGAAYNAYSLSESIPDVSAALERTGQAVDSGFLNTKELVDSLSSSFSEPLAESAQMATATRSVLRYARQRQLQYEQTAESLAQKKGLLETLENSEAQAERINSVLRQNSREPSEPLRAESVLPADSADRETETEASVEQFPPTHAESNVSKKASFKFPGINKLNDALHGIIDHDPEATRRNTIGKTREQISQLQEAVVVAKEDSEKTKELVKEGLMDSHKTKLNDLRAIMIAFAKCQLEWSKANASLWREVQEQAEKISI
ncbi:hypothetical protein CANCADRAFT_95560 [Tortispora caseinolytica NRRL Y-17796]|uniref:PX domain-containing protein n=1 Tax=Tortispora caseinolytica NRRL Y-17796 TaxID=767744 RepID=A0A1E4TMK5_9ASCO|nr:hypothetical protein CANCADRAFT_95560 [Tortispora caseinolytica NRRL Y-17796]